jgi:23S rRNA (pseudouridine1915-N3)-methyltransferase
MASEAYLFVVGKLKDKNLEAIENDYLKRITHPKLKIIEVKANAESRDQESKNLIKKIQDTFKDKKPYIILLAEYGKEHDSRGFAKYIEYKTEQNSHLAFVIAGAEGYGQEVLDLHNDKISLSKLTFPHKLARILFVEQFYRAQTINNNHPYHN